MRSGADLRGASPLVSFNHVIDLIGWRGGTTDLCPGRQKPSLRHRFPVSGMICILSLSPAVCIQHSPTVTLTLMITLHLQWSLVHRQAICKLSPFRSTPIRILSCASCFLTWWLASCWAVVNISRTAYNVMYDHVMFQYLCVCVFLIRTTVVILTVVVFYP